MSKTVKTSLQLLIIIIIVASSFVFSACTPVEELDHYHEFEYFRAVEKSDFQDYDDICLIGLTEKGKEQEALYFKKYVDHYKVDRIDDPYGVFDFTSDNLKKIIMEGDIKISRSDFFYKFKNLDKVILLDIEDNSLNIDIINCLFDLGNQVLYVPSIYEEICRDVLSKDRQIDNDDKFHICNVEYMLNYYFENPNDEYYFFDDIDVGETIIITPRDPYRSMYNFTGWYKEPECINQFDFNNDTRASNTTLKLYAGWENKY